MRNITTVLASLLDTRDKTRALSIVMSTIGENLWLVADAISEGKQTINASGLTVGDYVLHEDQQLLTNLGAVTMEVKNV